MTKIKKIVVVGNANSTFTKGFIKYVLAEKNVPITLISENNDLFEDVYKDNNVNVIAVREKSKVERIPILKTLNYLFQVCRNLRKEKADLIIVHYAWPYLLQVFPLLHLKARTVITYWGSDLFRATKKELERAEKAIKIADCIVVLTDEMKEVFIRQYGKNFESKLALIDFGVSAFESIDRVEQSQFKKADFIGKSNEGKVTITIGYNARAEQQHELVVRSLATLSQNEKNKVLLLYPMTYPNGKERYVNYIKELSEKLGFQCKVITDYMGEEEIAKLCVSTDVFIHAQTTDALSTSMLEYLYSGAVVLNGCWLHYNFLDELGVKYQQFDFTTLLPGVEKIIKGEITRNKKNKHCLRNNCSWDVCSEKWNRLIDKL